MVVLQLLKKRPFYTLRIDAALTQEQREVKLAEVLDFIESRLRGLFELETGGKTFCKAIVETFALLLLEACMTHGIAG